MISSTSLENRATERAASPSFVARYMSPTMSRFRDTRRRLASQPQLRADQLRDLAAVGAALGLAHHVADDRADRGTHAVLDLRGFVGVGLDRRLDNRVELT